MAQVTDATHSTDISSFRAAMPFWLSLLLIPLAWIATLQGGWWIVALPFVAWHLFIAIDAVLGLDLRNRDPETAEAQIFWHKLVTLLWMPLQIATVFGALAYVSATDHLHWLEEWALFATFGILSGTIGINYSHELMHQKPRSERWFADLLLASVLYSHFRSEHLLVHHRYVATPRDPVTARYGEGFHRFFIRVLHQCPTSAFKAEAAMQARKGNPWWHRSNPFWRYAALQGGFLVAAIAIGGLWGLFLFLVQAFWAVFQLELVNYVEHYGLTREHLGDGKYEPVRPRHSWNSAHQGSNWLLINLQRHSDHHYKPNRRFPLLQTYSEDEAPQLPYGYNLMTMMALLPSYWRKRMNPRVDAWRAKFYPDVSDWTPYNRGETPAPR